MKSFAERVMLFAICMALLFGTLGLTTHNVSAVQKTKQDFRTICYYVRNYLVNSCGAYVKSTGALTTEGTRAYNCITSGGLLTLIGSYGGLPPSTIRSILEPLSIRYNCGGIVDWNALERDSAGLLNAIRTLHFLGIL